MYREAVTGLTPKGSQKKETTGPDTMPSRRFIERYIGRDSDETGDGAPGRPDQLSHEGIRVERTTAVEWCMRTT
jgi:hypothetical protein